MALKITPEMEDALRKIIEANDVNSEGYNEDDFLDKIVDFENDYMPDDIRQEYLSPTPSQDLLDWEKWVFKDTPWKDKFNGEAHDPDNGVTSQTVIDKDDDGDADITVIEQDDGNDTAKEKPHDEKLADEEKPHDPEPAGDDNQTNVIANILKDFRW